MRNFLLVSALLLAPTATGFLSSPRARVIEPKLAALNAKKKKTRGGAGFGKPPPAPPQPASEGTDVAATTTRSPTAPSTPDSSPFLQSVEAGGSKSIPTMEKVVMDPGLSAEERAQQVLRQQYGMRTPQEQAMENKLREQKQRVEELKRQAAQEEEDSFDIMAVLPAPLLKGIDTFLKLGVAVCTVLFVSAGMGITVEAWSKASDNPLPENIDTFIVQTIEPNFTPGLLVLLAFSVSLGGFSALQLSSGSAQYKEE